MTTEREQRIRVRFCIEPTAKAAFYEYVSSSAFPRDIGLAFGDLAYFGREVTAVGLTLRQAAESLRFLARNRSVQRQVTKALSRQTDKLLREKLAALLAEGHQ